jgi:phage terminase large subunit-like protein
MKPFSIDHFAAYTANLKLDDGSYWVLEDFQAEIVEPILDAVRWRLDGKDTGGYEIWIIVPEGNAKTTLMAGVAMYLADFTITPWIPIGASSRDQASICAGQAFQMIRDSPGMDQRFRVYEGYRRAQPIRPGHPGPGKRGIKVHAAEVGTNDGVIPFPIAILDEGHRHPDLSLYRLWRGKCRKRGASIVMISTAGEPGTEFEEARDALRDRVEVRKIEGARFAGRSGKSVLIEWKVEPSKVKDMKAVKQANPLKTITVETLTEDFHSHTMDFGDWKRLKCNLPSRASNAAISDNEWEAAYTDWRPDAKQHADLGVDVAWKHDTFAIVPLVQRGDANVIADPIVLKTPRDGSMLSIDDVKVAFDEMLNRYQVDTVIIDMSRAEDTATWLEQERSLKVIEWSQGSAQAADDYERFMQGLRNGKLLHTGSAVLRTHVMNAIARALPGDKRRFDRPAQGRTAKKLQEERVIDALTGAYMVLSWLISRRAPIDLEDFRVTSLG